MFTDCEPLTQRQYEVYTYIKEYVAENGFSPTVREIATGLGIGSPNGVMSHLKALVRKGHIQLGGTYKSRNIRISDLIRNETEVDPQVPVNGLQLQFIKAVHRLMAQTNQSPSTRELMAELKYKSPHSITTLARECHSLGLLTYLPDRSRTIRLTDTCFAQST